jgi:hypothetical protein
MNINILTRAESEELIVMIRPEVSTESRAQEKRIEDY